MPPDHEICAVAHRSEIVDAADDDSARFFNGLKKPLSLSDDVCALSPQSTSRHLKYRVLRVLLLRIQRLIIELCHGNCPALSSIRIDTLSIISWIMMNCTKCDTARLNAMTNFKL